MQVLVLNGANLDVLARRDPKMYGGLSLNELESRIYGWAHTLDITARCRQTNSEGEFIEWIHDAYDNVDALIVNAGAWSHYSSAIGTRSSCSRYRSSRCTCRTSRIGRSGGASARRRGRIASRTWKGPRRISRGARVSRGKGGAMTRLAALGERLDAPLLVTNLTNVFYLCGFDSSNAALLVQPGGDTTRTTTSATPRRRRPCRASPSR